MIEAYCKKCDHPFGKYYEGTTCPKCKMQIERSFTLYWCDECNVPIYEDVCPSCGNEGHYIATDIRPVFPEENLLLSLLLTGKPFTYQKDSVWYGSNSYIVNGKKIKFSVSKINKKPIEELTEIKYRYEENLSQLSYEFFDAHKEKFITANADRFNEITEEATRMVQSYKDRYALEDMMVSFSGGKDSTVTSHIVRTALGSNNILHVFGDTTLEFPYTLEYKKRFNSRDEAN